MKVDAGLKVWWPGVASCSGPSIADRRKSLVRPPRGRPGRIQRRLDWFVGDPQSGRRRHVHLRADSAPGAVMSPFSSLRIGRWGRAPEGPTVCRRHSAQGEGTTMPDGLHHRQDQHRIAHRRTANGPFGLSDTYLEP
jgi:hypothetical protein